MFYKLFPGKKTYNLSIPNHLIQSIRVYQCLMEAGLKLQIDGGQKDTFEYLSRYFTVNYRLNGKATKELDVEISHSSPYVRIGSHRQPLVFSHEVFERCSSYWSDKRETDFLFIGLMTPERADYIKGIKSQLYSNSNRTLKIIDSTKGRTFPDKAWDEDYYKKMGRVKFAICPNGDFIWTYRFFEAILCGAIPVVEEDCELYRNFTYYTSIDDALTWDYSTALQNLHIARNMLGPPESLRGLLNV